MLWTMMRAVLILVLSVIPLLGRAESPSPRETPVKIQMPNAKVADVIALYAQLSKRKVEVASGLTGRITIVTQHDIPVRQAISLIRDTLMQNGIEVRELGASAAFVYRPTPPPVTAGPVEVSPAPTVRPIKWPPPAP